MRRASMSICESRLAAGSWRLARFFRQVGPVFPEDQLEAAPSSALSFVDVRDVGDAILLVLEKAGRDSATCWRPPP